MQALSVLSKAHTNMRPQPKTKETSSVFGEGQSPAAEEAPAEEQSPGHGANGADAYRAAE